ncbi:HD family phosphohydrolase [Candidatus Symbiobacter mobilis]|uniref:HD-GYP domain protein n=1 Tax=Candidatus Symbiobacter mobilis CR TaxID=946483 RepID=U5NAN2_9BURK|nr:HD family phosphohydrolase [Candidatus Symbiobacter mobilis]AGX88452.1 HD-GYP domain protein [Candidatus Symbiobacter mobilis CR]
MDTTDPCHACTDSNTVEGLLARLDQLNEIGASLSSERNITLLLERILIAAKTITRADGGTVYRMLEDGKTLRFEILRTDSLHIAMGGSAKDPIHFPDLPLCNTDGTPNDSLVAAYAAMHKVTINIEDAYTDPHFDFSGTRRFDQTTGYRSKSFLTVPMCSHEGDVIGVLQLINAQCPDHTCVVPFSQADQQLVESLASQASIALNNRQLMKQLEDLFESFIGLINLAIDEKSPYTGGHCQRVPQITMMLAEAATRTQEGPLADFRLSELDRYELKIAALLHDCGKITTPVHVVDKATKLQTLFDRIALLDTRFEVLLRDAEIDALRKQLALRPCREAEPEIHILTQMRERQAQIRADRDFLRKSNRGGEAMSDENIARVRDIATGYLWRNADGLQTDFLNADESENLCIRKGTLTAAERDTINYHIVATIKMLEKLPWPKHLRHVPEFAGGHHERMDGKGYPNGLTREQMTVQARIMGIADIFEALTACDRPYKPGMKLSQAMRIMKELKDQGHIDPDLFDIFCKDKVYLTYAMEHLDPLQIDEVPACCR